MRMGSFILLVLLAACEPELDCQLDPNTNHFYIRFNHDATTSFTFDSVKNNLLPNIFFDADSTFSVIQLPLTESENRITYTFYTDTVDYGITLSYESQINLYGEDCPPSTFFSNLEVVSYTAFDTVRVTNSELDRRISENIEAFF